MRVQTIESFLRAKLANLRQRLQGYGADPAQLDHVEGYLLADTEKGLTAYAYQLHQRWNELPIRAEQLVAYVGVPEAKKKAAVECVRAYLTAFVSVVQPDPLS
jgi:hypothetical protein